MFAPRSAGLGLAALLIVAACADAADPGSVPPSTSSGRPGAPPGGLVGPMWIVATIGGSDALAGKRPTMLFGSDGQLQGNASCNGYSGPYRLDGDAIEVGELMSTMMMCADESIGVQETAFLAALRGVQTWRIDASGNLVLGGVSEIVAEQGAAGPSGSADASADASAEASAGLAGAWDLAEMGPTADFAYLLPTIEFTPDGGVSGFAGCNTFSGSYATDGATLTFGPLAMTRMACQRPGSAVEADYLAALSGVTSWAIEADGRLLLDGAVPLRYTRH